MPYYRIVPDDTRGLLGSTILHPSLTPSQGFGVEFLMTFILTFTFFATMDPKRRNQGNDAIALGMTMTLLHIVGVSDDCYMAVIDNSSFSFCFVWLTFFSLLFLKDE